MTDLATPSTLLTPTLPTFGDPAHVVFEKRPRRGPGLYDRTLSPEARRGEQRKILVEAAAHVFARDGFVNASVASILDASGLSRGTFYRHFEDVRAAFLAVQENAAEVLFSRVEAAFFGTADPVDKLRACIRAYLDLCAEYGDLSRVLHREAGMSVGHSAALRRDNLERLHRLFREGLELAHEKGFVKQVPDELTIQAFIGAVESVAMRYLEEHREQSISEALEPLVRLGRRAFA